ncbi:MAG: S1/P1 Nuclease [Bacteroidetes bacterium]|nr:MAG: S1/P1 Nuclease [Bacteroidota bacterium]
MKKQWNHKALYLVVVVTTPLLVSGFWGFSPHKELHAVAITGLPHPLFGFYKTYQNDIINRATDADKRKHGVEGEAAKHYIDLDKFPNGIKSCGWYEACDKYGEDSLLERGVLPWNIERVYISLVLEMSKSGEKGDYSTTLNRILRLSADLGHYVGDAHVPLHTTSNYNGQKTGQSGIHALWETHVYETSRTRWTGRKVHAVYIEDIRKWIWNVINDSHSDVEEVLVKERITRERPDAPEIWGYRTRGRTLSLIPTPAFCEEYGRALDGMVERRFYMSAEGIASVWYSAWVDAGAPDLYSDFPLNFLKENNDTCGAFIKLKNELRRFFQDL